LGANDTAGLLLLGQSGRQLNVDLASADMALHVVHRRRELLSSKWLRTLMIASKLLDLASWAIKYGDNLLLNHEAIGKRDRSGVSVKLRVSDEPLSDGRWTQIALADLEGNLATKQ
jgi:hypothetical protein